MAHLGFNAMAVEPASNRELLPKGMYVAVCEKSEVKPTRKGTGHVLSLTFVIIEGEHAKRKIFDYVNIQNENPTAQRIGQQHLAAFCKAVNIAQLEFSYQLHGIPVQIEVGVKEAKDGYEAKNVIRGFASYTQTDSTPMMSTPKPAEPVNQTINQSSAPKASESIMDDDIPF